MHHKYNLLYIDYVLKSYWLKCSHFIYKAHQSHRQLMGVSIELAFFGKQFDNSFQNKNVYAF